MKRLLFVAFFIEMGFVLIVIPWSAFWDRNYFAQLLPPLRALITDNFVRGAVSGLGLIDVAVGITELVSIVLVRSPERPASISPARFTGEP
ncbi:MAG: hypothetical protein HY824_08520 [Acidobacteria bacterium]|nr:hypothetical protein [Acidobacteriota bacterium]